MSVNQETNSNPVVTQQRKDLSVKDPKKLKERITDLLKGDAKFSKMKQGDKILLVSAVSGLFTAVLPLLAVGATLIIPGAVVGFALFFSVTAAQYGFKGLKWSAKKTVEGAKYTAEKVKDASTYAAGKVRDGAVHVKDKVKEGYEHSVDSLKKGASFVGEGVANKFHKASGETDYLDKVKRFTPDTIKKSDEIRNDMKAIFADKGNNSGLVKNILSGISSEIDLKMAEKAKSGEIEHTSGWQVQKEFINNLNEKSLHNLLTQRSLPKGSYFIDSVFSEHHDEIKKVIKECRENHLYSSVSNMFDRAEKKANRPSVKSLTRSVSSSFSSLGRKGSEQSNSLSKSSSLDSVKTESTTGNEAELLNPTSHKEVKTPTSLKDRVLSWLRGGKAPGKAAEIQYQDLPESNMPSSVKIGNSTSIPNENTGNSVDSLASDSSYHSTTSELRDSGNDTVSERGSFSSTEEMVKNTDKTVDELDKAMDECYKTIEEMELIGSQQPSFEGARILTRSNSVDSLASDSSYHSTTSELSGSGNDTVSERGSFGSRRNSDSGMGSSDSFVQMRLNLSEGDLTKARLKLRRTGSLDKLLGQPAMKMDSTNVLQLAAQTAAKTN